MPNELDVFRVHPYALSFEAGGNDGFTKRVL
jgi:hypothetical protein